IDESATKTYPCELTGYRTARHAVRFLRARIRLHDMKGLTGDRASLIRAATAKQVDAASPGQRTSGHGSRQLGGIRLRAPMLNCFSFSDRAAGFCTSSNIISAAEPARRIHHSRRCE